MNLEKGLPIKITPDPIIETILEIRFSTLIENSKVFGLLLQKLLNKDYSNFENTVALPFALGPDTSLINPISAYINNDYYKLGLGSNVLSISTRSTYLGWKNMFNEIRKVFTPLIDKRDIIDKITRIGLRYVNYFEKKKYPLNDVLSLNVAFDNAGNYSRSNIILSTTLQKEAIWINLNINDNAVLIKNPGEIGCVIDIDVYRLFETKLDSSTLFDYIDEIHHQEKILFFSLLQDGYIPKFSPEYGGE